MATDALQAVPLEVVQGLEVPVRGAYVRVGNRLKKIRTSTNDMINGAVVAKATCTRDKIQPLFLYHNLIVHEAGTLRGPCDRVLFAGMAGQHEPGGVDVVDCLESLRAEGAQAFFVKMPEEMVLHYFHEFTHDEPGAEYGKPMHPEPALIVPPKFGA